MIRVENVSKYYKKKRALSNVSFEVYENQIMGLIGPNGAGKSTMMRIISGVNYPSKGQICKEKDINISVVFDYNALYSKLTAYENLLFYYRLNRKPKKEDEKKVCEVLEKLNLLNEKDVRVKTFSKGMLRKLAIARAIISEPNLLILDEPFDGLDVESHAYMVKFLKEWSKGKKHAIIFSSHNMLEVENICTNIAILDKGEIKLNSSLDELRKRKNERRCLVLSKNYDEETIKRIMIKLNMNSYTYSNGQIYIYENIGDGNLIWSEFAEAGIEIREFKSVYDSLEDIYMMEIRNDAESN